LDKSEKERKSMEKTIEMVRERVSITLPKEVLEWIDKKIESRIYANRSHAIEVLILEAIKKEKQQP
jgi:metal-responsive CopG/Arc/MetJ family transcriptional regulator